MTAPTRSADRSPRRGNWAARLVRSRRSGPRPDAAPRTDHGLWTVDRVIRVLATACDRENRPVPVAHVMVVGPESVRFHLKTPDQRPPAGWTADHDGRTWQAQLRWLQSASVAESLADPYPRLVPLGRTSEGFVLLNLGQAGGIIGLEGDAREARALAQDWTRELAASPWSREVRVVRIGFKSEAGAAGSDGSATPAGAGTGSGGSGGSGGTQDPADAEAALEDEAGGVLLLAGLPGGRDRERYLRLADDPDGRWAVVVVGRTEHARWRFTVDSAGYVDTGLLDERVAHHPDTPVEPPARTEADTAADTAAGGGAAGRGPRSGTGSGSGSGSRSGPAVNRRRIIIAGVVALCLAGAGVGIALGNSSSSSEPVAHAADNTASPSHTAASSPSPDSPSPVDTATGAPPTSGPASAPASGKAPAGNAPKPPGAPLKNSATGKCLSATAGTDGTPLVLAACDGSLVQRWHVAPDGTIQAKGLCMDAAWGGTTPGTVVQIANCSGNAAQKFSLRGDTVFSKQAALCLSTANGGIRLAPCGAGGPESFKRP